MQDINKIPLDAAELTGIWNTYVNDSMAICVLKHFLNNVEDVDTRPIVQHALNLSTEHIKVLTNFFNQEGLPVPDGFSEDKDLNINAPRLFDDQFYLMYLTFMSRIGMQKYAHLLAHMARTDLRAFFTKCYNESGDLYNKLAETRLSKGTFIRAPQVEVLKRVQYIEDKSLMLDWFGEKRSMVAREITHLFGSMIANIVGRAVATGFGQVSETDEVVEYMFRGRDLAGKRIELFSTILTKENIPISSTSDSYVKDSTTAPFSEKLMMFHIVALASVAITDFGTAIADSLRGDLQANYIRLLTETLNFAADGTNIMIKSKWLEQPPQAIDHKKLAISHS